MVLHFHLENLSKTLYPRPWASEGWAF